MEPKEWYDKKLKTIEKSLGYRLESIILNLTEKICRSMEEKKINRSKLAKLLEVSPPAVTKILNGTSNFTLKTLLSLADALELDLEIDFKKRQAGIFQAVTAEQDGVISQATADVSLYTYGEMLFMECKYPGDVGISLQEEPGVTSGISIGFAESANATFSFGLTGTKHETEAGSQKVYWFKTMSQEAA